MLGPGLAILHQSNQTQQWPTSDLVGIRKGYGELRWGRPAFSAYIQYYASTVCFGYENRPEQSSRAPDGVLAPETYQDET